MKKVVFIICFVFGSTSIASIENLLVKGRIISFDFKVVTIEIAGENYKFNREKLGKALTALKRGEAIEISIDRKILK